jgi:hypothetical protein
MERSFAEKFVWLVGRALRFGGRPSSNELAGADVRLHLLE